MINDPFFFPNSIKRNVSPLLAGPTSPGQFNKLENIMTSVLQCNGGTVGSPTIKPVAGTMPVVTAPVPTTTPVGISNVSSTNGLCKSLPEQSQTVASGVLSPQQATEMDDYVSCITRETSPAGVAQWLIVHRLSAYAKTFAQFSGSDILRYEDQARISNEL